MYMPMVVIPHTGAGDVATVGRTLGRGRWPLITPRALVVDPSAAYGDRLDVVLRNAGVWAMQASSAGEAVRLLDHMAFELVAAAEAAAVPAHIGRLGRAIQAAGCGPVLALTRLSRYEPAQLAALGARAEVSTPFTPETFAALVSSLGVGTLTTRLVPADLAG
jgi:hypothetical protein